MKKMFLFYLFSPVVYVISAIGGPWSWYRVDDLTTYQDGNVDDFDSVHGFFDDISDLMLQYPALLFWVREKIQSKHSTISNKEFIRSFTTADKSIDLSEIKRLWQTLIEFDIIEQSPDYNTYFFTDKMTAFILINFGLI